MRGQSFLEVIFAVGIIMLTATGVISLLVASAGGRKKSLDWKRASELGEQTVENLAEQKDSYPEKFWLLTPTTTAIDPNYPGYNYKVDFIYVDNLKYPGCNVGTTDCTEAVVDVGWTSGIGTTGNFKITKFFSRK